MLDRPFAAIADHVLRFGLQRDVWKDVEASAPRAAAGVELLMRPGIGPLRLLAPVRVVAVVDEADRQGFVYGTLQGHPEAGEERFVVERRADRTVLLVIEYWSRPARWFTRVAGPLGRFAQQRATAAYLSAAEDVPLNR